MSTQIDHFVKGRPSMEQAEKVEDNEQQCTHSTYTIS